MSDNNFHGKHSNVTELVVNAFYKVQRKLGAGFHHKVYEDSLATELRKLGFHVHQQQQLNVFRDGEVVGEHIADLVVNDVVMIDVNAGQVIPAGQLADEHEMRFVNRLKSTPVEVGLVLDFSPSAEIQHRVFENDLKDECVPK